MAETQTAGVGAAPALGRVLLAQGDARAIPLRDGSVHCVVTSPPYFGLRDYETATWEGGAPDCSHAPSDTPTQRGLATSTLEGGKKTTGHQREGYKGSCPRCGAIRVDDQIGLEKLHDCLGWATGTNCGACYICHLRQVFDEVWRVLRHDGTLWLNIADSFNAAGRTGQGTREGYKQQTVRASANGVDTCRSTAPGLKPKSLIGIPWRLALALQADGWILRKEIIWFKPNGYPSPVKDRPTYSHEQLFLFSKQARYFYDQDAIREPYSESGLNDAKHKYGWGRKVNGKMQQLIANGTHGKGGLNDPTKTRDAMYHHDGANARSVWSIPTESCPYAHFATMATEVARRCILAGTSAHGVCHACGAPWERLVERQRLLDGHIPVSGAFCKPTDPWGAPVNGIGHNRYSTITKEKGWEPTCRCGAPIARAIVFDPFAGSGTTCLVARDLHRHSIGMDLSHAYLHNEARERLGLKALHAWEHGATPQPVTYDDLPLFSLGG